MKNQEVSGADVIKGEVYILDPNPVVFKDKVTANYISLHAKKVHFTFSQKTLNQASKTKSIVILEKKDF
jgi:hypothetical protein